MNTLCTIRNEVHRQHTVGSTNTVAKEMSPSTKMKTI